MGNKNPFKKEDTALNVAAKRYTGETQQESLGGGIVDYREDISFNTKVKLRVLNKFKMLKDQKSRVAFILFHKDGSPKIKQSYTFYDEAEGFNFRAPKNQDLLRRVVDKYGEPSVKFGTILLTYLTDKNGKMLTPAEEGAKLYGLEAYIFTATKFPVYSGMHQEWDLKEHDIMLSCSDEKYQKIDVQVQSDCFIRTSHQIFAEAVADAERLYGLLKKYLGRELKDADIVSMLGDTGGVVQGESYNPFGGNAVDGSQGQIADQVGAAGASNNFSDLVEDPGVVDTTGEVVSTAGEEPIAL